MQRFRVKIRRDLTDVRPGAEQIDGKVFKFREGWSMDAEDTSIYEGETAMLPHDDSYPVDAPTWIASGDLIAVDGGE